MSFEEDIKGSPKVGMVADIVVLCDDPTKVPPDTIKDIGEEKTIVGGKGGSVYSDAFRGIGFERR